MKNIDIIDSIENQNQIEEQLKANQKKTLLRIIILIAFNVIMFAFFIKGHSIKENLLLSLNANVIGFSIIGFALGRYLQFSHIKNLHMPKNI